MKPMRVGLLGMGVVGTGTFNVLRRNQDEIVRRTGRPILITMVADLNLERTRDVVQGSCEIVSDARLVVNHPDIDIVIELIGGLDEAKNFILQAIANGKHVVTANKALIAVHGDEIFQTAQKNGVMVGFEAAVGGGIPIIKVLREGLSANRIQWLAGIVNGTTNFILSEMRGKGKNFNATLAEAQQLGYAEKDPTFDIEGIDAGHKIAIMASIGFGIPIQFEKVYIEGITKLQTVDMQYAEKLGYRVKLLAIAKRVKDGVELRVHPTLIPSKRLIAHVDGAMNAVLVQADAVGTTLYYGKGAGSEPTGSAVIADLVEITRLATIDPQYHAPFLAFQPDAISDIQVLPISEVSTGYYLRMCVVDDQGVLAEVTRIMADASISIDAMLQKESISGGKHIDIIMLTRQAYEKNICLAIANLELLSTVVGKVIQIRVEELA